MKNKQNHNFNKFFTKRKYITDLLSDNIRSGENSMTRRWTFILTTWVFGETSSAAVPWANGGVGLYKRKFFRWNGMTQLYTAIMTSLLYSKKNTAIEYCVGVDV